MKGPIATNSSAMESHRNTVVEQIDKHYQVLMVELRVRLLAQIMEQEKSVLLVFNIFKGYYLPDLAHYVACCCCFQCYISC